MAGQETSFEAYSYRTSSRFGSRVKVSVEGQAVSVSGPRVGVIIYRLWIAEQLVSWYPVPVKGTPARIVMASVFAITALVFGLVAIFVYAWVVGCWPDSAPQIYLWLGGGLAVLLSIAGVIVPSILKRKGPVVAWTLMNFLWGLGYGWEISISDPPSEAAPGRGPSKAQSKGQARLERRPASFAHRHRSRWRKRGSGTVVCASTAVAPLLRYKQYRWPTGQPP